MDENLGEIGIDSPVSILISIGYRTPGNLPTYAHMVKLVLNGSQTHFDVTQAFATRKLGECHTQVLVPAGERSDPVITLIATNAAAKLMLGHKVHELGENHPSVVHMSTHFVCEHKNEHQRIGVQIDNGKISSQLLAA